MTRIFARLPCGAALLLGAAVAWADPPSTIDWSTFEVVHCARDAGSAMRLVVRSVDYVRSACSISLHAAPLSGRVVDVSVRFRSDSPGHANIALLLTQFEGTRVRIRQIDRESLEPGREVVLHLRSYLGIGSDRATVGLETSAGNGTIDVTDLAVVASAAPVDERVVGGLARSVLDQVLDLVEAKAYAFDPARHRDLLATTRQLASGAEEPAELHDALAWLITQLGDEHSRLFSPTTATAITIAETKPPYGIERRPIGSRIGYVGIPAYQSLHGEERSAYARYLRWTLLQALDGDRPGIDGLVVDLRANDGGSFTAMLDGVCPLLDPGRPAGGFRYRNGRRYDWTCRRQARDAHGASARTIPIAVLVGARTASAGEMLAIALHGRDRTVLIGAPTRGLTTGVELFPLRDGAMLALATSVSTDREGHLVAHGVRPDLPMADDAAASSDPADASIVEALRWIDATRAQAPHGSQRVPDGRKALPGISRPG